MRTLFSWLHHILPILLVKMQSRYISGLGGYRNLSWKVPGSAQKADGFQAVLPRAWETPGVALGLRCSVGGRDKWWERRREGELWTHAWAGLALCPLQAEHLQSVSFKGKVLLLAGETSLKNHCVIPVHPFTKRQVIVMRVPGAFPLFQGNGHSAHLLLSPLERLAVDSRVRQPLSSCRSFRLPMYVTLDLYVSTWLCLPFGLWAPNWE